MWIVKLKHIYVRNLQCIFQRLCAQVGAEYQVSFDKYLSIWLVTCVNRHLVRRHRADSNVSSYTVACYNLSDLSSGGCTVSLAKLTCYVLRLFSLTFFVFFSKKIKISAVNIWYIKRYSLFLINLVIVSLTTIF